MMVSTSPAPEYRHHHAVDGPYRHDSASVAGGLRSAFLASLHCPYTGGVLRLIERRAGNDERILFGIVRGEAGEFPIIDGILRLLVDELRSPLVDAVKDGRLNEARQLAFDVPFRDRGGEFINFLARVAYPRNFKTGMWVVERVKRRLHDIFTDTGLSFMETARRMGSHTWAEWQIYRFSTPTFLPQFALAHLAAPQFPVLDFGCGVGQGTFLLSRESPVHLVCADYSFSALYLARKYFAPKADFVCLDGDFPLPFAPRYFGTVYSSDAFHFIDSKLLLAGEFRRVLRAKGTIVLPHVHNARSAVQSGKSLSAQGYGALFEGLQYNVLPEEEVIRDFANEGVLDLARTYNAAVLDGARNGFSIVAGEDPAVFVRHQGLWKHHQRRLQAPIINPIYDVRRSGNETRLHRHVMQNSRTELPPTELLPDAVSIPVDRTNTAGLRTFAAEDPVRYAELVRQLVVIDGPARFGPD